MSCFVVVELVVDGICVNMVNFDGVIVGSKIWEGDWVEGCVKVYGIKVEDLFVYYVNCNLLKQIICLEDIVNGVFVFVGILDKSIGNILNVDGGMLGVFI